MNMLVTGGAGFIGDQILVNRIFQQFEVQAVINFAAESHVD